MTLVTPNSSDQTARHQLDRILIGGIIARALFALAELKIADYITDTPVSYQELAQKSNTHAPTLYSLLRLASKHAIFKEVTPGFFEHTPFSQLLTKDQLQSFFAQDDPTRWNALGHITYTVSTGKPAFNNLYNTDYFNYLKQHPELAHRFDEGMRVLSQQEEELISRSYNFSDYTTIVDIGGGRGGMLAHILKRHPSVHGVLFDLPHVVVENSSTLDPELILARCTLHAGSFFETIPSGGDLYILKRVLHDWDDTQALTILKTVARILEPPTKLLIIEPIIGIGDHQDMICAIDLFLRIIFGGAERTKEQFIELLDQAGLIISTIIPTNSLVSLIEVTKKQN